MTSEVVVAAGVGLGLAAACGFRVFVPLLVLGLGGYFGRLPLAHGFEWLATVPALLALGTAAVLEVLAYYVPWLDHLLDVVATPAAVLAGMLATASIAIDLPPFLKWAVVLVGGGAGNPLVASAELVGATSLALLAVVLPLLALLLTALILVLTWRTARRLLFGRFSPRART